VVAAKFTCVAVSFRTPVAVRRRLADIYSSFSMHIHRPCVTNYGSSRR
jgi:hypothetical protein